MYSRYNARAEIEYMHAVQSQSGANQNTTQRTMITKALRHLCTTQMSAAAWAVMLVADHDRSGQRVEEDLVAMMK